jgi:hypothetical protein
VENEWDGLEAQFVTKLREDRVEPVPAPIVRLAQLSLDGTTHPDNPDVTLHAMQREFESVERAAAFAKHMKNAGPHTNPPSSVTVAVDPNRTKVQARNAETGELLFKDNGKPDMVPGPSVNPRLVAWRAGARRGRAAA